MCSHIIVKIEFINKKNFKELKSAIYIHKLKKEIFFQGGGDAKVLVEKVTKKGTYLLTTPFTIDKIKKKFPEAKFVYVDDVIIDLISII